MGSSSINRTRIVIVPSDCPRVGRAGPRASETVSRYDWRYKFSYSNRAKRLEGQIIIELLDLASELPRRGGTPLLNAGSLSLTAC